MSEHAVNPVDGEIARVPSLVPGFDAVLCGGFLQGGVYLIQGPPGVGKTVLAKQIIYRRAAAGDRALFITALGENHGRMLAHMRPMRFFDTTLLPERVTYISAYHALDSDGLKGFATLILREVQARGATLLVLDGMSAVEAMAGAGFEMKRFNHELQTLASATNYTMLLLTTTGGTTAPEHTMVDGLIELRQRLYGSATSAAFWSRNSAAVSSWKASTLPYYARRCRRVPPARGSPRQADTT